MVAEQEAPTQSYEGAPARPATVSSYDGLTVYGPLGIFCTILLAIIAVLWRDQRSARREYLTQLDTMTKANANELERRDRACKEERDQFRATMEVMAQEISEASKKMGEQWRDHARELRSALESATRKIGSRE